MKDSTKYCLTAILCTLIAVAAYLVTNRYDHAGSGLLQRDNWTGTIDRMPAKTTTPQQ